MLGILAKFPAKSYTFPSRDNTQSLNKYRFYKKLNPHNKWVMLAELIPWQKFEAEYAANFPEKMGAPAKYFRIALGSLIIQEILGYTDLFIRINYGLDKRE